jgi:putative ABC transport system permease protein
LSLVLRESLGAAVAGIVPGILGSFGLTRMLESQLFGVRPSDPWTYVLAPTILVAIALAGAYFPARRAASVDPAVALRHS